MTLYDMNLRLVGDQPIEVYEKIDGKETKIYDGPYNKMPASLEEYEIEEVGVKDNKLQLYVFS